MPLYTYQAKNKENGIYDSSFDAPTRVELYSHIREEGGVLVSLSEPKGRQDLGVFFASLFKDIKTHDKILLAKNLSSMIKAGLVVTRALAVMEKQTKSKKLKALYSGLALDISHGETLSDSMNKRQYIFSPLFISMVKAGEESGNLTGSLEIVANQMEKSYMLTKKVKGALIYPAVVLVAMVIILVLMLIYMVPTLTSTFKGLGVELPLSTRIIIGVSDFLLAHTIVFLLGAGLFIFGIVLFYKSKLGQRVMDVVSIRLPVIGEIAREVQSARTARTLSSLLSSGVDIVMALGVTIEVVQNSLYKKSLEKARTAIQKGEPMSDIFVQHDNLYPAFVGEMIAVGEETGKISEMLLGVAVYYEDDVDERTKDLSTIIEPLLMIFIGAGVGVFAVSMLAPTYSLVNNI